MNIKKFISFSNDFKKQHHNCDTVVQNSIDAVLEKLSASVIYMGKQELPYTKLNLKIRIKGTSDKLIVWVKPDPRIVVKQLG